MSRLSGASMLWRSPMGQCLCAGAVLPLAFAPFGLLPVAMLAYLLFYLALDGAPSWTQAAWRGWLFGFGQFVTGLYWTGSAILVEADRFWWVLPFAVLAFPAFLGLFPAGASAVFHLVRQKYPPPPASLAMRSIALRSVLMGTLLALLLSLVEYMRATLLTGFPWNSPVMIWVEWAPLSQIVAWAGVATANLLVLLWLCVPAALWGAARRRLACGISISIVLVMMVAGGFYLDLRRGSVDPLAQVPLAQDPLAQDPLAQDRMSGATPIAIVQPNIPQEQKWLNATRQQIAREVLAATATAKSASIIIWPETALPFYLDEEPAFPEALRQALASGQTVITGALRREAVGEQMQYFNSVQIWTAAGILQAQSDKVHLVPFGEYLPFQSTLEWIGLRQLTQLRGGFTPGKPDPILQLVSGAAFIPLVCYEAIFPLTTSHRAQTQFLVNVTNDAWFGASTGPYQHLALARLRSLESGLPLIRAANTGISAVIDGTGQIIARKGLGEKGVLNAQLPARLTPPPQFGRSGLIFSIFLTIGFLICFANLTSKR